MVRAVAPEWCNLGVLRADFSIAPTVGLVKSRRLASGPSLINHSQERAWSRSIEEPDEGAGEARSLALFPEDRADGLLHDAAVVRLRLSQLRLCRPRQWGAVWLAW